MSVLKVDGISKSFKDKKVLDFVTASFETGHCVGLLGNNGAGKTTLLKIIMQLIKADEGEVLIDGQEIKGDELLKQICCCGVNFEFPHDFSVKTILKLSKSFRPDFDYEYALSLIDKFGLNVKTKFGKLSTGETTLLLDVIGLASNARFVIFDEPVLGVDVNYRDIFYSELASKIGDENHCYIIVTHLVSEIEKLIDKAVILKNGDVEECGDVDDIISKYYSVEGKIDNVRAAVGDNFVIGMEEIGNYRRAYICAENGFSTSDPEVTSSLMDLQTIVKYLIEEKSHE